MLLREHSASVPKASEGLLRSIPDSVLPRLLRAETDADATLRLSLRRKIKEWIEGDEPGGAETLPRRQQLLLAIRATQAAPQYAGSRHDWALALAIAPNVDVSRIRPGGGNIVTIYSGLRSIEQLRQIASLWPEIMELSRHALTLSPDLRQAIEAWCFPGRHVRSGLDAERGSFSLHAAEGMLRDIQTLSACGRVCRLWIRQTARHAGLSVPVKIDRRFQRIFESRDTSRDWRTHQRRREKLLSAVAIELLKLGPDEALRELAAMETAGGCPVGC